MADENDDIEPDATAPGTDGRTRLMQEVAEQMDAIEADFGRDFEIGRVITIVERYGTRRQCRALTFEPDDPWVSLGMPSLRRKACKPEWAAR